MSDVDELRNKEKESKVKINIEVKVDNNWYSKLVNIKGIGNEIVSDLSKIYNTEEDLIKALSQDKVPIRNDKVILLKDYYKD